MFLASKLLALLTQPLGWAAALLLIGLLVARRRPRAARRLTLAALILLVGTGWQVPPDTLLHTLETRYPEWVPDADTREYVGAIVLGGGLAPGYVAQAHNQPALNDAAERMTAAVSLVQHNPHLRLIFTGGEGALLASGPSEAARAKVFFNAMGLPPSQVQYEAASRNTFDNATFSAKLPGVDPRQKWLLVTSAWHMPRAMASFTKAGWNISAYPTDFRTGTSTPWTEYSLAQGAAHWQLALHEALGLLAYALVGRS